MPITARPDPNNPGQWIWVDSATGQPATQPGGQGTPYVAPSDQPANVNIDPNAGARPATTPYGPPSPGTGGTPQTAPAVGTPQGPAGMYTVDQSTAAAAAEVQAANVSVAGIWDQVRSTQATVDALQQSTNPLDQQKLVSASGNLNTLYQTLSQAEQRVETANAAYSTSLGKAIDQNLVDPSQIDLAKSQAGKADADAATARAQAQVLVDGAPGQRALVAAQAGQASASAAAQQATADATTAKTPAEVQQLTAQANALTAQANQTNALLPGLIDKQKAETGLTQAQTDLTGSQSDLAKAQATQAQANAGLINAQTAQTNAQTGTLLPAQAQLATAQAGLAGTQGTNQLSQAAQNLAGIQQNLLGPLYGLQDKLNAIRSIQQQVFGPGGSGDPAEANDLLNQFTTSTIAGTTPYAANVAAANAGLTAFGTQASLANAAQQALATRANAYTGLGGNVLSTLAGINANAPAGSTAMAGAFQNVMDYMAGKLNTPQFAPPQQPTAPQLPALLQRLAPGGSSAVQGGPGGAQPMPNMPPGAPGMGGAQPMPNPAGAPAAAPSPMPFNPQASTAAMNAAGFMDNPAGRAAMGQAAPQLLQTPQAAPQTSAPVTINIGGQSSAPNPTPNYPPNQGAFSGAMPSMLQQYSPPTTDFVHQLWGNELNSGAVQSPYATPNSSPASSTTGAASPYAAMGAT
jgi:hypothetical protein